MSKRALVVDDGDESVHYLSALLGDQGWRVDTARDGAEALEKARASEPGVVISDLLMPVMDGFTLLRRWKADPQLSHIPFVVHTAAYINPRQQALARSLGADDFIPKPADPRELLSRLGSLARCQPSDDPDAADSQALSQHNQALTRELEQKSELLEQATRALQTDVAQLERAEAALRESEADFRYLTDAMPQIVWIAGRNGKCSFLNRRGIEYTGLSLAEAKAHGLHPVLHPEDKKRALSAWQQAVSSGEPYEVEARLRRSDGTYRWWLIRGMPAYDVDRAHVAKWFGTCTDIHGLKVAEAELRRTEEQLRHAQKLEAVGVLAGGIAHDFNNILSVIHGCASLALGELSPGQSLHEDLSQILRAAERASGLTRQLLAFSRRQKLEPRVIEPRAIIAAMEPMLRRLLGEQVELSISADASRSRVFADPGQFEQVVMNLAVNARDAMPEGGRLSIETTDLELTREEAKLAEEFGAGRHVLITVSDTGTGVTPEVRERMFDPFFTTKEPGRGTGLGLSTVFGIVKQSGGHIWVESAAGAGATFKIALPATQEVARPTLTPSRPPTSTRGSETILLVEDDDEVREVTRSVLRRQGYQVLDARNGGEALLVCESAEQTIDLLITDMVMPRMTGRQLAERLTAMRPALRVLYVSGYSPDGVDPASDFLSKPVPPEVLLLKVRELLDDRP